MGPDAVVRAEGEGVAAGDEPRAAGEGDGVANSPRGSACNLSVLGRMHHRTQHLCAGQGAAKVSLESQGRYKVKQNSCKGSDKKEKYTCHISDVPCEDVIAVSMFTEEEGNVTREVEARNEGRGSHRDRRGQGPTRFHWRCSAGQTGQTAGSPTGS